jgi:hypothetical protein
MKKKIITICIINLCILTAGCILYTNTKSKHWSIYEEYSIVNECIFSNKHIKKNDMPAALIWKVINELSPFCTCYVSEMKDRIGFIEFRAKLSERVQGVSNNLDVIFNETIQRCIAKGLKHRLTEDDLDELFKK